MTSKSNQNYQPLHSSQKQQQSQIKLSPFLSSSGQQEFENLLENFEGKEDTQNEEVIQAMGRNEEVISRRNIQPEELNRDQLLNEMYLQQQKIAAIEEKHRQEMQEKNSNIQNLQLRINDLKQQLTEQIDIHNELLESKEKELEIKEKSLKATEKRYQGDMDFLKYQFSIENNKLKKQVEIVNNQIMFPPKQNQLLQSRNSPFQRAIFPLLKQMNEVAEMCYASEPTFIKSIREMASLIKDIDQQCSQFVNQNPLMEEQQQQLTSKKQQQLKSPQYLQKQNLQQSQKKKQPPQQTNTFKEFVYQKLKDWNKNQTGQSEQRKSLNTQSPLPSHSQKKVASKSMTENSKNSLSPIISKVCKTSAYKTPQRSASQGFNSLI